MNNAYTNNQYPYYINIPIYNPNNLYNPYQMYPYPYYSNMPMYNPQVMDQLPNQYGDIHNIKKPVNSITLKDYGPEPFVINIEDATLQNNTFRTALWTGKHLQVTLMSIKPGEDIGLENHPDLDQFIRIEQGQGLVKMGDKKDNLNFQEKIYDDYAIVIPAGKWHNLINTGTEPLKLYSIYAPPQHPFGTVHQTKADAEAAEENHER